MENKELKEVCKGCGYWTKDDNDPKYRCYTSSCPASIRDNKQSMIAGGILEDKSYKSMDIDKLGKILLDLIPEPTDREWLVMQGCRTHGAVTRSTLDLNLCSDEKCVSCQQFHQSLKDICNAKD